MQVTRARFVLDPCSSSGTEIQSNGTERSPDHSITSVISRILTSTQRRRKQYAVFITTTYLYNFDPLKPHFYIVKLGFTGVYIIFLISAQNIDFQFLEMKFSIYWNRRVFVMLLSYNMFGKSPVR